MNLKELYRTHQYENVVALCKTELGRTPGDPGWLAELGESLLCLGRLDEALSQYQLADKFRDARLNSRPFLNRIGSIQWLLGRHDDSMETLKSAVDGILDGSIEFADAAGGVSQGLLLWYAGVAACDDAAKQHALKYLRKLAGKSCSRLWPGPLAAFALGEKPQATVLAELGGTTDLKTLLKRAKKDLLTRRELVQALFYFGVRERSEGNEAECLAWLAKCANLENPILEVEWYLANGELKPRAS